MAAAFFEFVVNWLRLILPYVEVVVKIFAVLGLKAIVQLVGNHLVGATLKRKQFAL